MENTRDYRTINLVATEAKAERLTKQPSYRAHHIFHDNLIAVERYNTSVKMDKPIYTGMYSLIIFSCLLHKFEQLAKIDLLLYLYYIIFHFSPPYFQKYFHKFQL